MRILHAKPETACAKMSEFGSFCVHHVALNGEAVKSNQLLHVSGNLTKNLLTESGCLCYFILDRSVKRSDEESTYYSGFTEKVPLWLRGTRQRNVEDGF